MAMPPCGTFRYLGTVPAAPADRAFGQWHLDDESSGRPGTRLDVHPWWRFWSRPDPLDSGNDRLLNNRLLGLHPTLRVNGGRFVLEPTDRHRAVLASAELRLDPRLSDCFQAGDLLTLVRTRSADIAVTLTRLGRLVFAVGAVAGVPLGSDMVARDPTRERPPLLDLVLWRFGLRKLNLGLEVRNPCLEVLVSGEVHRLRARDEVVIGNHRVSVVCCRTDWNGAAGCAAISDEALCSHPVALRSAQLLADPGSGLIMGQSL